MILKYIEKMKSSDKDSETKFINNIIIDELIINTSYPTVILDRNFKILFVNQSLLRLFQVPFEKTFMKNYLAVASYDENHFYDIKRVFDEILVSKKHRLVDLEKYPAYIHIFPILSSRTEEVEYFQIIHVIGEKHLEMIRKHEVNFNNDYVLFAHQLSVLLATKDKYTAHHSSNVAKYAAILGKEIGIENTELKLLEAAGSLHDIGKINIPNRILNKKGMLSPDEREIVENHTIYTSKILRGLKIHELSEHGKISEVGFVSPRMV